MGSVYNTVINILIGSAPFFPVLLGIHRQAAHPYSILGVKLLAKSPDAAKAVAERVKFQITARTLSAFLVHQVITIKARVRKHRGFCRSLRITPANFAISWSVHPKQVESALRVMDERKLIQVIQVGGWQPEDAAWLAQQHLTLPRSHSHWTCMRSCRQVLLAPEQEQGRGQGRGAGPTLASQRALRWRPMTSRSALTLSRPSASRRRLPAPSP